MKNTFPDFQVDCGEIFKICNQKIHAGMFFSSLGEKCKKNPVFHRLMAKKLIKIKGKDLKTGRQLYKSTWLGLVHGILNLSGLSNVWLHRHVFL